MTGRNSADRLVQVRLWVAEHAASLGVPVSVSLLCETAVGRLGVSGATVVANAPPGWPETRHATDKLGAELAELQLTLGEGPSTDAEHAGGPVLVADLDTPGSQRRWPVFAPLAVETGAGALFALPLCVGAIQVGILALHRVAAGRLAPEALIDALAFAEFALLLVLDERTDALPLYDPQLHQATGMIAAQLGVGMDDAFARLRAHAFTLCRPLAEVAADVVARKVHMAPDRESYAEETDGGEGDGR